MVKRDTLKVDSVTISAIYTQVIFRDCINDKMTISELSEEMEIRGYNPNLYSEKAFLKLILQLVENYENKRVSLKDAKNILEEAINKKGLQRWGDGLIVTPLFLDYAEKTGEGNFDVDITQLEIEKRSEKISLVCPYCENPEVQVQPKKTEEEYNCPECNKEFLAIIGIVRGARGLGGYVAHQVVIRIKNIEGGESTISYYPRYQGLDIRSGDLISAIYKMESGWLSSGYSDKPALMQNFNLGTYTTKL